MAVKPILTVTGSLDKVKTQQMLQKQLNDIGKKLTLTIAYDKSGEASDKRRTNEKNKQEQAERRMAKMQMEAIRMDEKRTASIKAQANLENQMVQNQQREVQSQRESIKNEERKLDLMRRQSQLQLNNLSGRQGIDQSSINSLSENIRGAQNVGDLREYNQQIRELGASANNASGGFGNLARTMGHNILKMAEWGISGALIFGTLNKIKDAIELIVQLDTAMANIRMASGLTQSETAGLSAEYNKLAKELGVTTKVIADSAVDLFRQGLSMAEANAQLQDYIKLSKVINRDLQSTIELGTAATTIYSTSIQHLSDVATSVGDTLASSADEVLQIVQKSGAVAQNAGVTLEELATMGGILASMTRESGSQLGNSIKNVFSKLQQVDELTGEVNDDYGKTIDRIASFGIKVEDSNGTILGAMDILKNLGKEWVNLSEQQQAFISSGFGVHQANKFQLMLRAVSTDIGEYNRVLDVATNSTGALNKKYEEYSGTVEASSQRLKATWEDLYINVLNSGMIQSTIELTTTFVDLVNKTNILQGAMVALGVAIGYFLISKFSMMMIMLPEMIVMITKFGLATTASIMGINTAMLPMIATFAGLTVLASALFYVSKEMERLDNIAIATSKTVTEQNAKVKELATSISDLQGKTELTDGEQKRLKSTYESLLVIYPQLANEVDKNTLSYDTLREATMKLANEQRKLAEDALNAKKATLESLLATERATQKNRRESKGSVFGGGSLGIEQKDLVGVAQGNIEIIKGEIDAINKSISDLNKSKVVISDFEPVVKDATFGAGGTYTPDKKDKTSSSSKPDILDRYKSQITTLKELTHQTNILKATSDLLEGEARIKAQEKVTKGYIAQQNALSKFTNQLVADLKKGGLNAEDKEKLNNQIRQNTEEFFSLKSAIKGVADEHEAYDEKIAKEYKDNADKLAKSMEELFGKRLKKLMEEQSEQLEILAKDEALIAKQRTDIAEKAERDYAKSEEKRIEGLENEREAIIDAMEASIEKAKEEKEAVEKIHEMTIKSLEARKEEELALHDVIINKAQMEIDAYNNAQEVQKEINTLKEIENSLIEKNIEFQEELLKLTKERDNILTNKNIRMIKSDGSGFEWIADENALSEVNENITEITKSHNEDIISLNKDKEEELLAQSEKAKLNALEMALENAKKLKEIEEKRIDTAIALERENQRLEIEKLNNAIANSEKTKKIKNDELSLIIKNAKIAKDIEVERLKDVVEGRRAEEEVINDGYKRKTEALQTFHKDINTQLEENGKVQSDIYAKLLGIDKTFFEEKLKGFKGMAFSINKEMGAVTSQSDKGSGEVGKGSGKVESLGSDGGTFFQGGIPKQSKATGFKFSDPNNQKVLNEDDFREIMFKNALAYEEAKLLGDTDKMNWYASDNQYFGNLIGADFDPKTGKWDVLEYHNGIENGLVGGLPVPKSFEQIAMLAKGEAVFTNKQMTNLSSVISSLIPSSNNKGAVGGSVYNFDKLVLPNVANPNDFIKELRQIRITNG